MIGEYGENVMRRGVSRRIKIRNLIIPGYVQLKRKELGKGYMIIALQSAAILGGFTADKNNGLYFGAAGIIYLYNFFDGIFKFKK